MTQPAAASLDNLSSESDAALRHQQQKLRLEFLNALHVAFKGARFFPPQNESVIRKIRELLEFIKAVVRTEGNCNIEHVHGFLMMNASRIKTDAASLAPYNFMMETMGRLKVGVVTFDAAASFEDLRAFLYVFAKVDPKDAGGDPYRMLEESLKPLGLTAVTIAPEDQASLDSRNEDLRKSSIDIYFRSISVAKSILENAHAGKAVNFRRAKRAVQTMVDIAGEDEFFLLALSSIKNYDEYTYNHSANVAVLSITFGQHLGFGKRMLGSLGMAALLHDVGKTDVDKEILNKSGKLTRDEWEAMKGHPMLGVKRLLRSSEMNEPLVRSIIVAFQHHKRIDLQGYPETKSSRELNFCSKIVAIADCYDALTTPRVYRSKSYSAAEALGIMLDDSGTVYDPLLLNKFAQFITLYPVGTIVHLDTGESALVFRVRHEMEFVDRPLVKLLTDPAGNRIEPVIADLTERDGDLYKRTVTAVIAPSKYFDNLEDYFKLL